jgi:hypothetical protein
MDMDPSASHFMPGLGPGIHAVVGQGPTSAGPAVKVSPLGPDQPFLNLLCDGGANVELSGVQNPGIGNLAELAQFITVDFG